MNTLRNRLAMLALTVMTTPLLGDLLMRAGNECEPWDCGFNHNQTVVAKPVHRAITFNHNQTATTK